MDYLEAFRHGGLPQKVRDWRKSFFKQQLYELTYRQYL